jgi:hypothetical protein
MRLTSCASLLRKVFSFFSIAERCVQQIKLWRVDYIRVVRAARPCNRGPISGEQTWWPGPWRLSGSVVHGSC